MKLTTFGPLLAVAALASAMPAFGAMDLSAQDKMFATKAAQGGMAEVADANLALTKSKNPAVTAFAQQMIADHGKANAKLTSIAQDKGVTLPAGVGRKNAALHAGLESLNGAAFNSKYLSEQKAAHVATAALMEQEISAGKDTDLVAFAKATLPTVQAHLALDEKDAQAMHGGMSGMKGM